MSWDCRPYRAPRGQKTVAGEARRLYLSGYRPCSNQYRIVARIDREDWKERMAHWHSPWSIEQGREWVRCLGSSAGWHYLSVYSRDALEHVDLYVYGALKKLVQLDGGRGKPLEFCPLKEKSGRAVRYILTKRDAKNETTGQHTITGADAAASEGQAWLSNPLLGGRGQRRHALLHDQ